MSTSPRAKQSGVAIITAILITTLASVAAYALSTELLLDIHRTANLIESDRAWLYAEGAEAWSKTVLLEDDQDNEHDHYGEGWATTLPPIEIEGGFITGAMEDMQGRFNLNSLAGTDADSVAYQRFTRLLSLLNLETQLAQAVIDWIDDDLNPFPPYGAEDGYYLGLTPAYRAANRLMSSVSELRLVKGFDQETYDTLRPFVCALPDTTPVNVNTAPPEVLAALDPDLSLPLAQQLVQQIKDAAFEGISDFTGTSLLEGIGVDPQGISVRSQYFLLRTDARVGSGRVRLSSLIQRDSQSARVLLRTLGQE